MRNFLEAWCQAVSREIPSYGQFCNIDAFELPSDEAMKFIDPWRINHKHPSIFDTASVIFPDLYEMKRWRYPEKFFEYNYPKFTKRFQPTWGIYYDRMTKWAGSENLILKAIDALNSWAKHTHCVFTFHTTNYSLNKYQPQGNPCLQYISLVKNKNQLSLVYAYRAQDFFGRFGGNTIGLMRLLKFVCYHTKLEPKALRGIVGYGFRSCNKKEAKILIERMNKAYEQERDSVRSK